MLLGWFRKRKMDSMDREELEELRTLTADLCEVLENVDLLLGLQDREELDFDTAMLWQPGYYKGWKSGAIERVPLLRQAVRMPEPMVKNSVVQSMDHHATHFMAHVTLSDWEIRLRRSPAEYRELAHRINADVQRNITDHLVGLADPVRRAKALKQ